MASLITTINISRETLFHNTNARTQFKSKSMLPDLGSHMALKGRYGLWKAFSMPKSNTTISLFSFPDLAQIWPIIAPSWVPVFQPALRSGVRSTCALCSHSNLINVNLCTGTHALRRTFLPQMAAWSHFCSPQPKMQLLFWRLDVLGKEGRLNVKDEGLIKTTFFPQKGIRPAAVANMAHQLACYSYSVGHYSWFGSGNFCTCKANFSPGRRQLLRTLQWYMIAHGLPHTNAWRPSCGG